MTFWSLFNEQYLANIHSFAIATSKFRITMDAELYPYINVHLHNVTRISFKQFGAGLYYCDTTDDTLTEYHNTDYTFLNTVESNKSCSHKINQISGQSGNTTATCRMSTYTNFKISCWKEPNQELTNYHWQHQNIRRHLWPSNTHYTRQGNHKDPRSP